MFWFEKYISIPWAGKSNPPETFNCGTFVQWVYKERLGIEIPDIWADANSLRQAVQNMGQVKVYGFEPCEPPYLPYDLVLMQRSVRYDHAALLVRSPTGLLFLHCADNRGVVLESKFEIVATTGCPKMTVFRHKEVTPELALCRA